MKKELSAERLRELLHYEPSTGVFTWRKARGGSAQPGSPAGFVDKWGYIAIGVERKYYRAHRLAWLYMYGAWPDGDLDHVDRVTSNNRIANLRVVSKSQNQQNTGPRKNNTSGCRGVCWVASRSKWKAEIGLAGKRVYLGVFSTIAEAAAEYERAASAMHSHRPAGADQSRLPDGRIRTIHREPEHV